MINEINGKEMLRQIRTNCFRPERESQIWSDDEKERLKDEFYSGTGYSEMALLHQRSETAINNMIEVLDLHNRKLNPKRHRQPKAVSEFLVPSVCLSNACPYYREGYTLPKNCTLCKEGE